MRLIRCHIENFGRLHDLTMEFNPDFQLIAEPNGWGKSTLAAFIRVMFFGFEGENKRKGTENGRKRYEPWQGGAYGGQITFETGGKTYTAVRIFGDKKANDSFELRDAQTNLKSDDFSENLGEEIFQINGESFARTVFIGQNDCATATTDSINAKISNLTDNMNDLDCYEKAAAALQDAQNKLTPRRKTGLLSQMNDEITGMQTEVRQNASLEEAIRDCTQRESEARAALQENRRQQDELFALSGQVSRAQDAKAKWEEYTRLCVACTLTEEACRSAEEYFPGEVPSEEELRSCMAVCDEMERAAEGMRIYALTEEEQKEFKELTAETTEGSDASSDSEEDAAEERESASRDPETCDAREDDVQAKDTQEENDLPKDDAQAPDAPRRKRSLTPASVLLLIGTILAVAGLVIYFAFLPYLQWLIVATAGVALILVGRMMRLSASRKKAAEANVHEQMERAMARERAMQEEALARETAAREEAQAREQAAREEAAAREQAIRLDILVEKLQNHRSARMQYEEKRAEVEEQIRRMGRSPEDPLGDQIQEIWRKRIDAQTARRDAQTALQNKKDFEDSTDMSFLLNTDPSQSDTSGRDQTGEKKQLPSMEELHDLQARLEEQAEQIRGQADAYASRLADLREKYDDWTLTGERLAAALEERDRVQEQFDQTRLALESLTTAKEAMTAKYMEPLMKSFSEYYGILTGEDAGADGADDSARIDAAQYRLDANTNLTVEEYGMQRETAYLSRGYQDMVGLCLRLALVDAMYPDEKPFLLLDDPFVNLDEENRAGGQRLMEAVTKRCQVIYFTCRGV